MRLKACTKNKQVKQFYVSLITKSLYNLNKKDNIIIIKSEKKIIHINGSNNYSLFTLKKYIN